MPQLDELNILYVVVLLLSIVTVVLLALLLKRKKSTRESELEEKLELSKKRVSYLNENLEKLQQELKVLDSSSKTSFLSDQIHKMERLEGEVLKQKQRVEEAKSIAQEAMSVKYGFLSNVRHEIRTPMNSILAFSDMLKQELQDPTQLSYVKNISTSGHTLLGFMDDIIELSKLESGAFDIHERAIDVRTLFEAVIQNYSRMANDKGLELDLNLDENLPSSLILDDKKISDILSNLIENAIKFTKNGFVHVKVTVVNFDDEKNLVDIVISVQDSGIGIDPSNFLKIFEIFEKAENASVMDFHSTGLGLSINRKMARFMNGDIIVKSKRNQGSTFEFSLNSVEIVLSSADDAEDNMSVDFKLIRPDGATIMVVDEGVESRDLIRESYEGSAVEVLTFDHPRDAIEALKSKKFDLIFIDINILSIDENAVSKVIASMSKAPVVSLTSVSLKEIDFVEGGARIIGHLKKPISKVELFKISLKALNNSELTKKQSATTANLSVTPIVEEKIDLKILKVFLEEHDKRVKELYQQAILTNDLNTIKEFSKELFKLSYTHKIDSLMNFSKELLSKIELFDIDTINIMMQEYKSKIEKLRNL